MPPAKRSFFMNLSFILGKHILFVTAHPDDESFLAAGLMHANYTAGWKNYLLCATHGEKGRAHLENHVEDDDLKNIRQAELSCASKLLRLQNYELMDLGDGKLPLKIHKFEGRIRE